MIDTAEIRRRASALDLREQHIERDYVLCHTLHHVSKILPELIFRGGTALARIFWPDYRLSEDLDFIAGDGVEAIDERVAEAVRMAAATSGRELTLNWGPFRSGWSRSTVYWREGELLVDINREAEIALLVAREQLDLPYSDLPNGDTISVVQRAEILGNKWYMLGDREEPRDLFDIWAALYLFDVPFDELAQGHIARYRYPPIANFIVRAERLARAWEERLAHQVADLPEFGRVRRDVAAKLHDWLRANDLE